MICTADQIKENEMGGACGMYWVEEKWIYFCGGKPEGKRPLERPQHKWENILKWILKK
jgi:molybdopterin-biosynthesis enzyme MoeA-like protein